MAKRNTKSTLRSNAISIYGRASKTILQRGYSYAQRKRVSTHARKGRPVKSYLRKTGKIVHVKAHYIYRQPRQTRFTFYGTTKECQEAVTKVKHEGLVPRKQFEDQIKAVDFLKHPEDYSKHGKWDWDDTKES